MKASSLMLAVLALALPSEHTGMVECFQLVPLPVGLAVSRFTSFSSCNQRMSLVRGGRGLSMAQIDAAPEVRLFNR